MIYVTQTRPGDTLTAELVACLVVGQAGNIYVADEQGHRFLYASGRIHEVHPCIECGVLLVGDASRYCHECLRQKLDADPEYYSAHACWKMIHSMGAAMGESARAGNRAVMERLARWADELTDDGGNAVRRMWKGGARR